MSGKGGGKGLKRGEEDMFDENDFDMDKVMEWESRLDKMSRSERMPKLMRMYLGRKAGPWGCDSSIFPHCTTFEVKFLTPLSCVWAGRCLNYILVCHLHVRYFNSLMTIINYRRQLVQHELRRRKHTPFSMRKNTPKHSPFTVKVT